MNQSSRLAFAVGLTPPLFWDFHAPMFFNALLTPAEEGGFIATNPETGTTTEGETVEEALANLREATALYLEEFPLPATRHALLTTFEITAHA